MVAVKYRLFVEKLVVLAKLETKCSLLSFYMVVVGEREPISKLKVRIYN
jgi:hypothetical protein